MSEYQFEQRFLTHRGRRFHFVSHEGSPAGARGEDAGIPAMWFLMRQGRRWAVMAQLAGQDQQELDRALCQWVDEHAFDPAADPRFT